MLGSALCLMLAGMQARAAETQDKGDVEARLIGGTIGFTWEDLPAGALRRQISGLDEAARNAAEARLREFRFPPEDLPSLRIDRGGALFYADHFTPPANSSQVTSESITPAEAALPVSPFPTNLHFHSKPGSANVIYLDFDGETITGTAWNSSLGRDSIQAVAFSSDGDYTTFSVSEQTVIKRVWQRVSEDYAQFDIDVTTERPATLDAHTAHALMTRDTDATGANNPSVGAGGVAYVNVFGGWNYSFYRPAWVYASNLFHDESYTGEAASHEVGHNMGLSHDGKVGGTAYYGGHGSGETSWAPIMGASYGRNVTQWSEGEYHLANNTEDDITIISGKLQHRIDDHAGTIAGATPLTLNASTWILATTPETDPENLATKNKGIIETDTDVDMFSFTTAAGEISISLLPWISPSLARGGNLDIEAKLLDGSGTVVAETNPPSATGAEFALTVPAGEFFLRITGVGTGDPSSATPTGYTSYSSVGQYFVTGTVVAAGGGMAPPEATLDVVDIVAGGQTAQVLNVTYSDNVAVDVSTLDDSDIRVTGPGGYDVTADLLDVDPPGNSSSVVAQYAVAAPAGSWQQAHNGAYQVFALSNSVADTDGEFVEEQLLGNFNCSIPWELYRADLDDDPGWLLEGAWAYGVPQGNAGDPSSGYDGTNVIGYNLAGAYGRGVAMEYATTPAIDCSSATESVVLEFQRWLGIENDDSATLEVSTNGVDWTEIWNAGGPVVDGQWVSVQHDLTSMAVGQDTVYVRWGLASSQDARVNCGWNIDMVEVLGNGTYLDTVVPPWSLSVSVNDPIRGTVTPGSGVYSNGTEVTLTAMPSNYFAFARWEGDQDGTGSVAQILMDTNKSVLGVFDEILTTNHPTPHWWLAEHGHTNDFEAAALDIGSNGIAFWESYITGADPTDPNDVFGITEVAHITNGMVSLSWSSVSGRVYSIQRALDLNAGFEPLPGATNLPWPTASYLAPATNVAVFYRLGVSLQQASP